MDGFVNFLKPPGMTSHDAVGYVRRQLGEKKVGHAGTLDPGAAGVLPVAVGRATRLIEYLDSVEKAYRAELVFGFSTDSGDDSGSVVERADVFAIPARERLLEAFAAFTGTITQVPPAHSAIKINGRRACDLLREGKQVEKECIFGRFGRFPRLQGIEEALPPSYGLGTRRRCRRRKERYRRRYRERFRLRSGRAVFADALGSGNGNAVSFRPGLVCNFRRSCRKRRTDLNKTQQT